MEKQIEDGKKRKKRRTWGNRRGGEGHVSHPVLRTKPDIHYM
jgi:hypothetical protein